MDQNTSSLNTVQCVFPLELTTRGSKKKMEKMSFSDHFAKVITREVLRDQTRDVTTIEVALPLPTSKPDQAKFVKKCLYVFKDGERS